MTIRNYHYESTDAGETLKHRGWRGTIQISLEDNIFHGRLILKKSDDLITYEGKTPKKLYKAFKQVVRRYKAELAKERED